MAKRKAKVKQPKVNKENWWYGFDHEKVNQTLTGGLTFLNYFCVYGEYSPVAVYRCDKPDLKKGHKKYVLLQASNGTGIIRGMTEKEIEPYRFQDAVHCLNCNVIVYSIMRHHNAYCNCRKNWVSIDGGKDYTKIGFRKEANYQVGTLDLLPDEFFLP